MKVKENGIIPIGFWVKDNDYCPVFKRLKWYHKWPKLFGFVYKNYKDATNYKYIKR